MFGRNTPYHTITARYARSPQPVSRLTLAIYTVLVSCTAAPITYVARTSSVFDATFQVMVYTSLTMLALWVVVLLIWGESYWTLKEKARAVRSIGDAASAAIFGWFVSAPVTLAATWIVSSI